MARLKQEPPISWRESPWFARAYDRSRGLRLRSVWAYVSGFFQTIAALSAARILLDLPARLRRPRFLQADDFEFLLCLILAAWLMSAAFWVFTHGYGSGRIDDKGITLARLAGAPASPWIVYWPWVTIDEIAIETLTLEGRAHDVLVVRTVDGASHPIGLDRKADRLAILARAERAGLGEAGPRTEGSRDGSESEGLPPG